MKKQKNLSCCVDYISRRTRNKQFRYAIKALLSLVLAVLFSYTFFLHYFRVLEPSSNIEIQGTATKNKASAGTDIRIRSVKVDGEIIPFDQLDFDGDWKYLDGLLVVTNPQTPTSIRCSVENAELLEIELQKHIGSGILKAFVNGRELGEIDLYASDWEKAVFKKDLAKISIFSNIWMFFALCAISFFLIEGILKLITKSREDERFWRYVKKVLVLIIILVVVMLTWFQMELSSAYETISQCFEIEFKYILLNMLTNGVIISLGFILTNRIWISNLLFTIFSFLVSIVNHYTIKLHGSPLSVLEIKNFRTALNVIGSYKIELDFIAIGIIIIFFVCILLCLLGKRLEGEPKRTWKWLLVRNVIILLSGVSIIYVGYLSPNPIKPQKTIGWLWDEAYHKYGYMASSIELIYRSGHAADMPDGYSSEKVESLTIESNLQVKEEKPDIILILNETFFDIRQITDVETDVPFMENIDSMDNVVKGYTVVPSTGGGTNASEYELLTSNSLQLMKGITPFSILDMKDANSIVSHLKQIGYTTTGAHSESSQNYARGRVYPDMGFEQSYFEGDFEKREYYGDRIYYETDESLYDNLISWYEADVQESPQFKYLLTIQNHGDWDINLPEQDLVHVQNGYGEHEQEINEFLSCMKLSDDAFFELTNYFKTVDKPVIVCMVGDHSPWFASSIVDDHYTEQEKMMRLRGTPFVIWSNYGLEGKDLGYISMNYLTPLLLKTAGVKTSPYYDYMLSLQEKIPVLTSYDIYRDVQGNDYNYQDITEHSDDVNGYFYLEYNNLQKNRIQKMFDANEK